MGQSTATEASAGRPGDYGGSVADDRARCDTGDVPFAASMYVVGPLIAFGVIAGLGAILRWTFDSDIARTQAKIFGAADPEPAATEDYGLLSVAGVVTSEDDAHALQRMLADAGIRATITPAPDGHMRVLVFTSDLETARRVVGGPAI